MWEGGINGDCCIWHECSIPEDQMDIAKGIFGGEGSPVPRKGKEQEIFEPKPIGGTANKKPWSKFLHQHDIQAFTNRSIMYTFNTTPWLKLYATKGAIDPRAWLFMDQTSPTKSSVLEKNELK